jgi:hypothetical protein
MWVCFFSMFAKSPWYLETAKGLKTKVVRARYITNNNYIDYKKGTHHPT